MGGASSPKDPDIQYSSPQSQPNCKMSPTAGVTNHRSPLSTVPQAKMPILSTALRTAHVDTRELQQEGLQFAIVVVLFHGALALAKCREFPFQPVPHRTLFW